MKRAGSKVRNTVNGMSDRTDNTEEKLVILRERITQNKGRKSIFKNEENINEH